MAVSIEIKVKITGVFPKERGVTVEYYTDALAEAMRPRWEALAAQLQQDHEISPEEAMANVMAENPCGSRVNFTMYQDPIPSGQDLIDWLMTPPRVPDLWLLAKHQGVTGDAPDMSGVQAMIGIESSKQVSVKTYDERVAAAAIPVAKP